MLKNLKYFFRSNKWEILCLRFDFVDNENGKSLKDYVPFILNQIVTCHLVISVRMLYQVNFIELYNHLNLSIKNIPQGSSNYFIGNLLKFIISF